MPNPNSGRFNLKLKTENKGQVTVEIINVVGTLVWTSNLSAEKNNLTIDLPNIEQGVYLIQVSEQNKKHYKKMVISK